MINKIKSRNFSPLVVWFTGLSGSGKSTLSAALENKLYQLNLKSVVLDGDMIRKGISSDLSFTAKDRSENIRRVLEISKLFLDKGIIVIVALISPYRKDRDVVKSEIGANNFVEVFVSTPLNVCESRDIKGLYKKARKGEIKNFTGINDVYEPPVSADIEINTSQLSIEKNTDIILEQLLSRWK